jgi:predicted transcriptional regulator
MTYEFLKQRYVDSGEGATARELARNSKSSIQAASNRLAKVATLGLAYAAERESVEGGGAQFRYVPVM